LVGVLIDDVYCGVSASTINHAMLKVCGKHPTCTVLQSLQTYADSLSLST
jgi:hypothetical protein